MESIAALPMYDWPERREEVDGEWAVIRDHLRVNGIKAPDGLVRRNGDMPAVPGGIRDAAGKVIAPDPASLLPDDLDLATLWRHPALVFGQTCWGPMESTGLADHVAVLGQPDYDGIEGGNGPFYSSALVMRLTDVPPETHVAPRTDGKPVLPIDLLRGRRLAYNSLESMSGLLALHHDLETSWLGLDLFAERIETGSHRGSIRAVAEGRADVAAIDARSWQLARGFELASRRLAVVGWTGLRRGLPFIVARGLAPLWTNIAGDILGSRSRSRIGNDR
ncbi:ABC transporter, phosphonate, periplasmic substrate-binding protein [Hartmannibacter diazotrophicus]|uniref:ABC transporter, phosphonate, periplasmic substrate-binding protein n=1 Tax=Hartmannibacter diazotrophicus TaxID=1482074 RepID=A0A2C9DD60_9HYPH|nr:PhnD/SsuA/transferrin family substrate-binding protein [Hartmannibacter diazotrophicus]SON58048.1 ABC transporter, phosphonate, periplasmic substrate-binding protein [Hartmannibacter diazotrophicus]